MSCRVTCLLFLSASAAFTVEPRKPLRDLNGDLLPTGAVARFGSVRLVHDAREMIISPDGKFLASVGHDQVRVWDLADGREVSRIDKKGKEYEGWAVAWVREGLVLTDIEGTRIVDWKTRKTVRTLENAQQQEQRVWPDIAVTHDCKRVAVSKSTGVVLHDLTAQKGTAGQKLGDRWLFNMVFSRDGKALAGVHVSGIQVWDVGTRGKIITFREKDVGDKYMPKVALSPDGTRLASLWWSKLSLWSTVDGLPVKGFEPPTFRVTHADFSADGKTLTVFDGEGWVRDLSPTSGKVMATRPAPWGGSAQITRFAVHESAQLVAMKHVNYPQISVWDLRTGKQYPTPNRYPQWLSGVQFVRPGVAVCQHRSGDLYFWQTKDGKLLDRHDARELRWGEVMSTDGKLRAGVRNVEKSVVILLDSATGKLLRNFNHGARDSWNIFPQFSPDGRIISTSTAEDRRYRLWDVATGKLLREVTLADRDRPHPGGAAISPDGRLFAVATQSLETRSGSVLLFESGTGKIRARVTTPVINGTQGIGDEERSISVAFTPNGRWLLVQGNEAVVVISVRDQKMLYQAKPGVSALSPDARWLAREPGWAQGSQHVWPQGIELLDLHTPKPATTRRVLPGHEMLVTGLAFSADGKQLVSCSEDGTALVWDMEFVRARAGTPELPTESRRSHADDKQLAAWFETLESANAEKAGDAITALENEPERAVALLAKRLAPVEGPAAETVRAIVRRLDAKRFVDREQATRELEKIGECAAPELEALLKGELPPEVTLRVRALLRRLEGDPDATQRRALRAIEVLEHIGTVEAKTLLRKLASGHPGATLTREAKKALAR